MERANRVLLFFLVLLVFSGKIHSESIQAFYSAARLADVSTFEENGKVGLKNAHGEVLIPAAYDAIGWSNGEFSVVDNVTGYRTGGLWGLINLKNNIITKPEYLDLFPADGSLIVAHKKDHGSLKARAGCINSSGKEVIPFSYDGLTISSFRAIAYVRTGNLFRRGLIDFQNNVLIPLSYRSIHPLGSLRYAVENFDNKSAIFSEDGKQLTNFLIDSISSFKKNYAVIYQNQRQGLIDRQGQVRLEPVYREIKVNDDGTVSARQPDAWLFLDGENNLLRQCNADSITSSYQDLLEIKTAGCIQLTDKEFKPWTDKLFSHIGTFKNERAVFISNDKAGIIDVRGSVIIRPVYKDLVIDRDFILASQAGGHGDQWIVLDSMGHPLTSKTYECIEPFNGTYFPVKKRGYWGALDASGKEIIACVHDSLLQHKNDHVVVKFRGQYGIIDLKETWIATPQPYKLQLLDQERYFLVTPKTKFLKSFDGNVIYFSDNKLEAKTGYLLEYLPSGEVWRIDFQGVITDRHVRPDDIEEIFPGSEGLRAIKRDGRYGFIDDRNRLRIANRYEDVKAFSETLAAVKILGKWGFINHGDRIAVQPVYDEVFPFKGDFAVVKQKNFFGLIDKAGNLILPVRYDSIIALQGQRFKVIQNGLAGLADATTGKMIINPKFDQLDDLGNGYIIVSRHGKFGLLNVQGLSTIPEIYDGLSFDRHNHQYIALKRSEWEVVKF